MAWSGLLTISGSTALLDRRWCGIRICNREVQLISARPIVNPTVWQRLSDWHWMGVPDPADRRVRRGAVIMSQPNVTISCLPFYRELNF
jgi:hypothetical protein